MKNLASYLAGFILLLAYAVAFWGMIYLVELIYGINKIQEQKIYVGPH